MSIVFCGNIKKKNQTTVYREHIAGRARPTLSIVKIVADGQSLVVVAFSAIILMTLISIGGSSVSNVCMEDLVDQYKRVSRECEESKFQN